MEYLKESKALFERAQRAAPGGVHSPVRAFGSVGGIPRFISRAQGAHLFDVDGNRYLDFCMSWGPLILGHQDPDVKSEIQKALDRGWSFGTVEPYSLELAEMITQSLPWAQMIRFVNSGTEAVMSALRLARGVTGRTQVLKFDGCYHGHVDSMLVKAGSGLTQLSSASSAGVSKQVAAETSVLPLDDIESMEHFFKNHGENLAAVILEPLPANYGLLPQEDQFLKRLEILSKQAGALLIFDEVITGFRVAWGGMAQRTGITPDIVTFGKVIGGGFPVGAYAGAKKWMQEVAPLGPVYQAGTLSANPISMIAGLRTLQKIRDLQPFDGLDEKTKKVKQRLESIAQKEGVPLYVTQESSLFWMCFGTSQAIRSLDQIPKSHAPFYSKIFHALLEEGVYLAPSAYEVGFLSIAHSDEDLEKFFECFQRALRKVLKVEGGLA